MQSATKNISFRILFVLSASAFSCLVFSLKAQSIFNVMLCFFISFLACIFFSNYMYSRLNINELFFEQDTQFPIWKKMAAHLTSISICLLYIKNSVLFNSRVIAEKDIWEIISKKFNINDAQMRIYTIVLCVLIFIAIYTFVYVCSKFFYLHGFSHIKSFVLSFDNFEIICIIAIMLILVLLGILSSINNPLFFFLKESGQITYRGVFGADSSYIVGYDYLSSPVLDDIRHPLMGIISIPVSIFAWITAIIIKLVTFLKIDIISAYGLGLIFAQGILGCASVILIKRIMCNITNELFSKVFTFFIVAACPFFLYLLIVERYVIITFYLILFLYTVNMRSSIQIKTIGFIAAVGAIFTSGILLPLLFVDVYKNKKMMLNRIKELLLTSSTIFFLTGRLAAIVNMFALSEGFLGDYSQPFKAVNIKYYIDFIRSVFIMPDWLYSSKGIYRNFTQNTFTINNIIFLAVAILCIVGFIYGRKQTIIRIAAIWVLLCAGLIAVLGLGVVANETILYSLYFLWAFAILFAYACYRLLPAKPAISILTVVSLGMGVFNFIQLFQMVLL